MRTLTIFLILSFLGCVQGTKKNKSVNNKPVSKSIKTKGINNGNINSGKTVKKQTVVKTNKEKVAVKNAEATNKNKLENKLEKRKEKKSQENKTGKIKKINKRNNLRITPKFKEKKSVSEKTEKKRLVNKWIKNDEFKNNAEKKSKSKKVKTKKNITSKKQKNRVAKKSKNIIKPLAGKKILKKGKTIRKKDDVEDKNISILKKINKHIRNSYKRRTYSTKYVKYRIGRRVTYKVKSRLIKKRLILTAKRLGIPKKNLIPFKMGRSIVFVEQLIKKGSEITYFFVHPNELTAYIALKRHVNKHGGRAFLFIGEGRHITKRIRYLIYKVKRFPFALDPNRIYTDKRTIRKEFIKVGYRKKFWANNKWYWRKYGRFIKRAVWKISGFYKHLAYVSPDPIVGVHDNQGLFWVKDIFRGRNRYKIAAKWYKKRRSWSADFIYVIRNKDFKHFKKRRMNVILQDNKKVPNDGSMSVYFASKRRWYMCVEVGRVGISRRLGKALKMLNAMRVYIDKKRKQEFDGRVYAE